MALIRWSILLLCTTTSALLIGCGLASGFLGGLVGAGFGAINSCSFGRCGQTGNVLWSLSGGSISELGPGGAGLLNPFAQAHGFALGETPAGLRMYVATDDGLSDYDGLIGAGPTNPIVADGCVAMGDVVVLGDGNVVATCSESGRLVKLDPESSREVESFSCCAGTEETFAPTALALAPDGSLLAGTTQVNRFDGQTGSFLGVAVEAGVNGATTYHDLIFGPSGNLYVSASPNVGVLEFDGQTFAFLRVFVSSGDQGVDTPTGLAFNAEGNLLVGGGENRLILEFDGQTGQLVREVFRGEQPGQVQFLAVRP